MAHPCTRATVGLPSCHISSNRAASQPRARWWSATGSAPESVAARDHARQVGPGTEGVGPGTSQHHHPDRWIVLGPGHPGPQAGDHLPGHGVAPLRPVDGQGEHRPVLRHQDVVGGRVSSLGHPPDGSPRGASGRGRPDRPGAAAGHPGRRRYRGRIPTAALLSFRLGGSDGVAVEAAKWQDALGRSASPLAPWPELALPTASFPGWPRTPPSPRAGRAGCRPRRRRPGGGREPLLAPPQPGGGGGRGRLLWPGGRPSSTTTTCPGSAPSSPTAPHLPPIAVGAT